MRNSHQLILAATFIALSAAPLPAQPSAPATQPAAIAALIRELGDSSFDLREKAAAQLTELDDTALPALKAAQKDPDPEISHRAAAIARAITEPTPERLGQIRATIAKALADADYPAAAKNQMLLARRARASIDECLAVGNDWQLACDWSRAVAGYQRALQRIDEVLGGDPENEPPPPRPMGRGPGGGSGPGPLDQNGKRGDPGLNDMQRRELTKRRAGVMLLIGHLQRDQLLDPAAAIATLSGIVETVPEFQGDLTTLLPQLAAEDPALRDHVRKTNEVNWDKIGRGLELLNQCELMEDLALTQERQGKIDDAILTLVRVANCRNHTTFDGLDEDIAHLARLFPQSSIGKDPAAITLAKLAPPPAPEPQKVLQITATGGTLTLDNNPLQPVTPIDSFTPVHHEIALQPPGDKPVIRLQATFKPGHNYSLYLNADSPFQLTQTNLADFNLGPIAINDFIQRPDKSWFAILTVGSKIYTATSKDLITWDAPQELPFNGIANNIYPALTVDHKGTLFLAWFSNPGSLEPRGTAGYSLWLTHSADAKSWAPPRPITVHTNGGWPLGSLHWTHTDTFRLSWRDYAATAANPADITQLDPINLPKDDPTANPFPLDPSLATDPAGHFHMVYTQNAQGIFYSTSTDAKTWSKPLCIMPPAANNAALNDPQIIIRQNNFALIYTVNSATYLRNGTLDNPGQLSDPIEINNGTVSRFHSSGESTFALASGESPMVLAAKILGR